MANVNSPTITLSSPPQYSSEEFKDENNSSLTYPSQAHIPQSSTPTDLPTYDHAKIDMPPDYIVTPEDPWPITKKLYFIGFLFWPLWFIGMGFSVFGRSDKTRMWGRRCATNSVIIILLFVYLVIAFNRTRNHLAD